MEKKGTAASPATARANRVLPTPGGPINKTPLGILAPKAKNRSGDFKNSTTSCNSSLASSTPATSEKLTVGLSLSKTLAFDLPKLNVWLVLPCACFIMKSNMAPKKIRGRKLINIPKKLPIPPAPRTDTSTPPAPLLTPATSNCSTMLEPDSFLEVY